MRCENISWITLDEYIDRKNILILDVRNVEEFEKSHIKYAVNVPYDEMSHIIDGIGKNYNRRYRHLSDSVEDYNIIIKGMKIEKSKIIIIYCDKGAHSFYICSKLSHAGYNAKSLVGGISNYKGRYLIKN